MRYKFVDAVNELLRDNANVWKLPREHHAIRQWLEIPEYYNYSLQVCKSQNEWLMSQMKCDKGENMQIAQPLDLYVV